MCYQGSVYCKTLKFREHFILKSKTPSHRKKKYSKDISPCEKKLKHFFDWAWGKKILKPPPGKKNSRGLPGKKKISKGLAEEKKF